MLWKYQEFKFTHLLPAAVSQVLLKPCQQIAEQAPGRKKKQQTNPWQNPFVRLGKSFFNKARTVINPRSCFEEVSKRILLVPAGKSFSPKPISTISTCGTTGKKKNTSWGFCFPSPKAQEWGTFPPSSIPTLFAQAGTFSVGGSSERWELRGITASGNYAARKEAGQQLPLLSSAGFSMLLVISRGKLTNYWRHLFSSPAYILFPAPCERAGLRSGILCHTHTGCSESFFFFVTKGLDCGFAL